jgi:hypothetical protein
VPVVANGGGVLVAAESWLGMLRGGQALFSFSFNPTAALKGNYLIFSIARWI